MASVFLILEKSRAVRGIILTLIIASVALVILDTFSGLPPSVTRSSFVAEGIIAIVFTVEYLARLWTAPLLYPELSPAKARLRFVFSLSSLIDLIAIVPFYLVLILPVDLQILRVVRVFRVVRMLKIDRYTSALDSVGAAIKSTANQLISSLVVIFLLLVVASVFMYLAEHDTQPDVFSNALSGLWWAISTVTTVGYGDIYPMTPFGKLLGALISLLGVGLVAIPTGIISAGFSEQMKKEDK
jgi:voltage-gated potassium channel